MASSFFSASFVLKSINLQLSELVINPEVDRAAAWKKVKQRHQFETFSNHFRIHRL